MWVCLCAAQWTWLSADDGGGKKKLLSSPRGVKNKSLSNVTSLSTLTSTAAAAQLSINNKKAQFSLTHRQREKERATLPFTHAKGGESICPREFLVGVFVLLLCVVGGFSLFHNNNNSNPPPIYYLCRFVKRLLIFQVLLLLLFFLS